MATGASKDKERIDDEESPFEDEGGAKETFFDASNIEDETERSEREEIRRKLEEVGVTWKSKWSTVEARRRLQKRLDAINAEFQGGTTAASGPGTIAPQPDQGNPTPSLSIETMFAAMMQQQAED